MQTVVEQATNVSEKIKVLFVCGHNSCRSQLAEALLRWHAGDRYEPLSAGLKPSQVHPLTLKVLQENGLPTQDVRAKDLSGMPKDIAYTIIVCEQGEDSCPADIPLGMVLEQWGFSDPAAAKGNESEQLNAFRIVFGQIDRRIRAWLRGELQ